MTSILHSFLRLPVWVRLWMVLWLIPVNIGTVVFMDWDHGVVVAILANGGMILNIPIVLYDRGFSKLMALPHVVLWTPLVIICCTELLDTSSLQGPALFVWALVITNVVSLSFDFRDFSHWLRGDRAIS